MDNIQHHALWRARNFCAKIWCYLPLGPAPQPPQGGKHITEVSDHLLRDIGVDPAALEAMRHQFPSQITHHRGL